MKLARRLLIFCFTLSSAAFVTAQVNFNYSFYQTSGQGLGAVSADFNRDGYPDLAVGTNGAVQVFMSTGHGTSFGAPVSYSVSGSPSDLITADVNGDGWSDLVVLPPYGGTVVQVYINNGNGTFHLGTPINLAAPTGNFISAGDVNNDGKVDLVIEELVNSGQNNQYVVYKGNGNGTFIAGQVISLPGLASRPVVYDLNSDGKLDIAAAVNKNAEIFWGNGDGTFSAPTVIPASDGYGDYDLAVGDFNNDSKPDLAIMTADFCGSACGTDTVYTYLGDGAGHFTLKSSFLVGGISAGGYLHVADLNDDQNMDVVIANTANFGGDVVYALGQGKRNLRYPGQLAPEYGDRLCGPGLQPGLEAGYCDTERDWQWLQLWTEYQRLHQLRAA